jgi:catechol 2,3-dioxygenase-like lactoylglutathione lyase family enzyme
MIALFPVTGSDPEETPRRNEDVITMRHFAFRATRANFEKAREELTALGIACEFQNHTIADSIYFHDPDGHEVEITTYEMSFDDSGSPT